MLAQVQRAPLFRPTPLSAHLPAGAKTATFHRVIGTSAATAPGSGTMYLAMLMEPLRAGETYTSISWLSGSTALGTGTHQWFTLARASDRVALRSTTNDTSTAWAADTVKTLNLSSVYVPDVDVQCYIGILVVASTQPTIRNYSTNSNVSGVTPAISGNSTTSLTTPVSDGTTFNALGAGASTFLYGWIS